MASLAKLLPPASVQQTPILLTPTTLPVPLLTSPLAKAFSFASTAGVLIYYYLRAGALVRDPLPTLVQDIVPIALLQSLFCAICLPTAGSWNSGTGDSGKSGKTLDGGASTGKRPGAVTSQGNAKRRLGTPSKSAGATRAFFDNSGAVGGSWSSRTMSTILSLVLTVAVPPVPLTILALVLGAPLYPTTLIPHTFALSLHVAVLGFLPIFYTHGVSSSAWRDVTAAWLPFDEAGVWSGTIGTMVGGWIGAIPIALDWDRDWQNWPCTVVWGAALGWATGRLLSTGLQLGIGARIHLTVSGSSRDSRQTSELSVSSEDKKRK